ncbi:MAG: glycosyltransferase [Thermodesulfobacteriota bacterium]
MKKISVILPTRGRSEILKRHLESMVQTASGIKDVELILCMDEDDAESRGVTHPGIDIIKIIKPHGRPLGEILRHGYGACSGQYVLLMNDDAVYRTKGWDSAIIEAFERFPDNVALVYGNDLDQGEKVPTFPALSRKACELMNGVCPAQYLNLHIESHILDIFRRLKALGHDRIVYLKDVVFEHLHHTLGKSAEDKTSRKKDPDFDDWQFMCFDIERGKTAARMAAYIQRQAAEKERRAEAGAEDSVHPEVSIVIFGANPEPFCKEKAGFMETDCRFEVLRCEGALNDCVSAARGEFIVFTSGAATPLPGWLDAMLKVMRSDEKIGAIGTKIINPRNGRVEHAGICFYESNGAVNITNVYNGFKADNRAVNKQREFQAVSAECMMARKAAYLDSGGITEDSKELWNIELCIRMKEKGRKILFAPGAVACGYASASAPYPDFSNKWRGKVKLDLKRRLAEDGFSLIEKNAAFSVAKN